MVAEFNMLMSSKGVPPRDNDLPPPNTVDLEEGAFLTEVAISAFQKTQEEQEAQVSGEPCGAARAVASTKVSLGESEDKHICNSRNQYGVLGKLPIGHAAPN